MGFLDSVGGFFGDWAGPLAGALGLYSAYQKDQSGKDYAKALQAQEQYNYDNAKLQNDAYNNYLNQAYGIAQGNAAAQNAATAAFREAFYASEAERQKQLKKGKKQLRRHTKKALANLTPYQAAGLAALPQHSALFDKGASALGLLGAYLQSPEQMAKLNQDGPILERGARTMPELPEHMRAKK